MAVKIRVGLVGATTDGTSWGARGHIPALKQLADYELRAICTAHEETARAAAEVYGAPLAFHDYNAMFAHPDIDLVSVAVRVPYHHEITMAALRAGKPVYCEWPLGANAAEAEAMAEAARKQSLLTMTGLQARSDPALMYLRELLADGYVGDVLSCHMTFFSQGSAERPPGRLWTLDRTKGANAFTIGGGHHLDALCYLLGEFSEVSAKLTARIGHVKVSGTDEVVDVTSPDTVAVSGVLESGVIASVFVAAVPSSVNAGWRLEIYGTDGSVTVSGRAGELRARSSATDGGEGPRAPRRPRGARALRAGAGGDAPGRAVQRCSGLCAPRRRHARWPKR